MIDGLLVVDKPAGITSHGVVGRIRRVVNQKKVGHAGTLDPDATGLMLVGLGRGTRLLRWLVGMDKTYTCEIVFGSATSTLDAAGETVGEWDMEDLQLEQVRTAARSLTGDIEQVPPMVSAIKIGGQRLHNLARQGIEIDRPPRKVRVGRFDISGLVADPRAPGPVASATVDCSSGTYVRTLAADLGTALGGGAHLRNLRRLRIGPFSLEEAAPLDQVTPELVLPCSAMVSQLPRIEVDSDVAAALRYGKKPPASVFGDLTGDCALFAASGELLAVYTKQAEQAPVAAVVLASH